MNKKFLSAILFGALMVTSSTGTFVSCKDYDDDIVMVMVVMKSNSVMERPLNYTMVQKENKVNRANQVLRVLQVLLLMIM